MIDLNFSIEKQKDSYLLLGSMNMNNTNEIKDLIPALEPINGSLIIDMSKLEHIDSAGILILIEGLHKLKKRCNKCQIVNIIQKIEDLAELYNMTQFLDLYR